MGGEKTTGATMVVGPNHALHFILTVLTFWACGGWLWVWLVAAIRNDRRVVPVGADGRPIRPPLFRDEDGMFNWPLVMFLGAFVFAVGVLFMVVIAA